MSEDLMGALAALVDGDREGALRRARAAAADVDGGPLAQSTFALQSLPPEERGEVLVALHPHVSHLAVVEFDVPDLPHASGEHLACLVERYQRGLGEYTEDRDLIAQGFLMPVLTGQLAPAHQQGARVNWEQPAAVWSEQVRQAGCTEVEVRPLHDCWSAPAFVLTARGGC